MSTKYHVCCWTEAAMETLKKKKPKENFKQERTTAEHQLSSSSTTHFCEARNDLLRVTLISKYTADPLGGKKVISRQA